MAQITEIVLRQRRFIALNTAAVTVLAIVISLLLPKHYRAGASILPPDNETRLSGLMGASLGQLAQAVTNFSLPIMATPSDLYASIIKSDTILVRVVDKLRLDSVYEVPTRWQAVEALREDFSVKVEAQGIIRLAVEARRPELAAAIANAIVDYLDTFNRELQQQKGRAYSAFLEQRLVETDSSLKSAAEEMRIFQTKYRAVSLEAQAEALIKSLAAQKGQLTSSEIELEIMRNSLSPDHPAVMAKELEVRETRRRLLDIEDGARTPQDSVLSALDLPLARIPDLSLQYAVLVRNLKIQEVTFELLSQQLEMYRLQAQRDTPTISILDRARIPEKAFKPRKRLIVITAFLFSFLFASAYVVLRASSSTTPELNSATWSSTKQAWGELRRKPLG